jgi:hypothetical protein
LKNFVKKITQEFASSLPNFGESSSDATQEQLLNDNNEEELELLLQFDETQTKKNVQQETAGSNQELNTKSEIITDINSTVAATSTANESAFLLETLPMSPKNVKSTTILKQKNKRLKNNNKVQEQSSSSSSSSFNQSQKEIITIATAELYDDNEQHIDDDNMFNDKEIYDIMELEEGDDIYADEGENTILGADDDDEFILVNYKSSNDDLTNDKEPQFIVEEMYSDEQSDDKPPKKKNSKRMPREIIDQYAQSTDNNQHICTKCVKVFSTRTNLIRHIQSHDGRKPYVCDLCNKGFTQSGSLKQQ